ncbi:MAG: hypothetical protein QOH05_2392 [Acetobacteraceae bacterium]|jgi:hypothetical protein|nr:hypothetical protein [Acetobacteraceae bacterium]
MMRDPVARQTIIDLIAYLETKLDTADGDPGTDSP